MISNDAKKLLVLACIAELGRRFYFIESSALKFQYIQAASKLSDYTQIKSAIPKHVKVDSLTLAENGEPPVVLPSPKDEGIDDVLWLIKYRQHIQFNPSTLKPLNILPVAFERPWQALSAVLRDKSQDVGPIVLFCAETLSKHPEFADDLTQALNQ